RAGAPRSTTICARPGTRHCASRATRPAPRPCGSPGPRRRRASCRRCSRWRVPARAPRRAGHGFKSTRKPARPLNNAGMTGNPITPKFSLLDRDHSILAFNERVMDWARRTDVPELERLRYLSIVSSNLDEFFEVRMAPQLAAAKANETRGQYTAQTFESLSAKVHQLVAQQYAIYNDELLPALEKKG